jgi:hypothetical protein
LDHLLVEHANEDFIVLNSGCLCCTVRSDLITTLGDLFLRRVRGETPQFQRVVVETTGLADPAPVLHTLMTDPLVVARYRMDGVKDKAGTPVFGRHDGQEQHRIEAEPHTLRLGQFRLQAREEQRARNDGERSDADNAQPHECPHGLDIDGEHIAEQQCGRLSCVSREEVQEPVPQEQFSSASRRSGVW